MIFNSFRKSLFLPNEDHQLASSGHTCVNEISLEHRVVGHGEGDNDRRIF